MKLLFICTFIAAGMSFLCPTYAEGHLADYFAVPIDSIGCDSIPALNHGVIHFVNSNMKKKVGRGECWDVAAEALNLLGATWDHNYGFGQEVDYQTQCIYPGDIIQFEGVTVKYDKNGRHYTETMGHHTAIIYEVTGKGEYFLAHQNTGFGGRKVDISRIDLKTITCGKFKIFRPVK